MSIGTKYYCRFALLALLAGFSSASSAVDYYFQVSIYGYTASPTATEACQKYYTAQGHTFNKITPHATLANTFDCWVTHAVTGLPQKLLTATRYGTSCPAGTVYDSAVGACNCPAGSSLYHGYCVTDCAEGAAFDQPTEDIVNDVPPACRTPEERCTYRKSHGAVAELNFRTAIENCRTNCSLKTTGPWPISCEYTGAPYIPGTGDGNENVVGAPTLQPPAETTPAPSNDPCPPGTDEGTVNGARYCAPITNSSGQPNQSPSLAGSSGTVTTSTTSTVTNANGTTTTTTITNGVTTGDSGTGSGEGGGGGPCDPTLENYFTCIEALIEQPDANAEQAIFDQAGNKVQIQWDNIEGQYGDAIQEGQNFSIDTPDGIGTSITSVLPNGASCSSYSWNMPGYTLQIPCTYLSDFKQFLAWALSIGTMIYIYKLATKPVGD